MKRRIIILGIVVIILLLAVGSCRKAGTWLVKEATPAHADVMIMLTGRLADRILQIDDLYQMRVSGKVWVVREDLGADSELERRGVEILAKAAQTRDALITLGVPADSILILPGNASSTRMEAETIRDHLRTQTGIGSVLLVTSSSHTRRAHMIFRAAFETLEDPPELYCSPSAYTDFHAGQWWKSRENIQSVVFEYLKMTSFLLFEKRKLKRGK